MHGAFNFHLQFSTDPHAVGVSDTVPNIGAGGVAMESFRVGDAGFNRGSNCTVGADAGEVEMIEEDYHDVL